MTTKKKKKRASKPKLSAETITITMDMSMSEEAQRALADENGALRLVVTEMAMELASLRMEAAILRSAQASRASSWALSPAHKEAGECDE